MNEPLKLLKAINNIDDELIMEANVEVFPTQKKPFWNISFARLAPFMAVIVLAVFITVGNLNRKPITTGGNPVVTVNSLSDAEKTAGFPISVPQKYGDDEIFTITVVNESVICVHYGSEEDVDMIIYKGTGSEDVSGDYTSYPDVQEIDYDYRAIQMKGNGGKIYLATWNDKQYSFAIRIPDGAELDDIKAVIRETH